MAERPRPWKTWPRGRDLGRLDRDLRRLARGVETLEDLAERPRRPRGRDLRRLGRDDRDHWNMADGRPMP